MVTIFLVSAEAENLGDSDVDTAVAAAGGLAQTVTRAVSSAVEVVNQGVNLAIDAIADEDSNNHFVKESRRDLKETRGAISDTLEAVVNSINEFGAEVEENPSALGVKVGSALSRADDFFQDVMSGDPGAVNKAAEFGGSLVTAPLAARSSVGALGGIVEEGVNATKQATHAVAKKAEIALRSQGVVTNNVSTVRARIEANIAQSVEARNSSNVDALFSSEKLLGSRLELGFNSSRKRAQNFAIGDFNIDGQQGKLFSLSGNNATPGTVGVPASRQFDTTFINGTDRAFDTEVKILESLGAQLNRNSTGSVRILSELKVCGSCSNVINQFESTYPRVKVLIETGPHPKKQRF